MNIPMESQLWIILYEVDLMIEAVCKMMGYDDFSSYKPDSIEEQYAGKFIYSLDNVSLLERQQNHNYIFNNLHRSAKFDVVRVV